MKRVYWIFIAVSIFAGCSHKNLPPASPSNNIMPLTETYWKLTELMGQQIVKKDDLNKEMHLILKKEGNRVSGHGGCNSFMGSYSIEDGNRISFSQLAGTLMACNNMEREKEFMEVLQKVDNYTINGKMLSLNKAKMATLARFEAVYTK